MKLAYLTCFILLGVLSLTGIASAIDFRVHVQVNSGVSPFDAISGAGVVITDTSATPAAQYTLSTNSSGRTSSSSPALITTNHQIVITVTQSGYATNTTTFNTGSFSELEGRDKIYRIYLTPSSVAPTGPMFVLNEKFANSAEGGCGSGWNKTATFIDAYSGTYEHCVQYSAFSAGSTYVVDSYLANTSVYDATGVCTRGGVVSGAPFRTTESQFSVLCVNKSIVRGYSGADGFTDRIMSNATVVLNAACPLPLREKGNATVQNGLLRHCTYVFNTAPEPPPVSGCAFTSVQWVDELNAAPITQNVYGWANGDYAEGDVVYPFVTLSDGCSGKTISFEIYKTYYDSSKTTADVGPFTMDTMERRVINDAQTLVSYKRWLPQWIAPSGPGAENAPVDYFFVAKVEGESVRSSLSPRLTVLEPLRKCTSDDDCTTEALPFCDTESGRCVARECTTNDDCTEEEFCSDAGGCVSDISACTFSNIEWHNKETDNEISGDLRAGADEKKCGDSIYLVAVGGNDVCSDLGDEEIVFKIMDNNVGDDDVISELSGFSIGNNFYSDYWTVTPPQESGFTNILSNALASQIYNGLQYYPIVEINGEEISSPHNTLRVGAPEEIDCRDDGDCSEGFTCDVECGICEARAETCRINSDCESTEFCNSESECVERCVLSNPEWISTTVNTLEGESVVRTINVDVTDGCSGKNILYELFESSGGQVGSYTWTLSDMAVEDGVTQTSRFNRPMKERGGEFYVKISISDDESVESVQSERITVSQESENETGETMNVRFNLVYGDGRFAVGSYDIKIYDSEEIVEELGARMQRGDDGFATETGEVSLEIGKTYNAKVFRSGSETSLADTDFEVVEGNEVVELTVERSSGGGSGGSGAASSGGFDLSSIIPIASLAVSAICPPCGIILSLLGGVVGGGSGSLGGLFGLILPFI